MNLKQHKSGSEAKTQDQPWYGQAETVATSPVAPVQSLEQPQTVVQVRYAPEAVERLIARASLLQDTHRQTLSPDQIEAIAAEVGIQPEFIQAAMAQEQQAAVSAEVLRTRQQTIAAVAATYGSIAGYGLIMALLLANHRAELVMLLAFIIPAFMALGLGLASRRRRWGAVAGAVLAVSVIFAATVGWHGSPNPDDWKIFALMIGTGAALGAAGAEGRRQVSKRLVKNRSHRTVIRERAY